MSPMSNDETDDLRPEYPPELIRSGVRGKYAKQFPSIDDTHRGASIIVGKSRSVAAQLIS